MNKIEVAQQLRLISETRLYRIPEFSGANIPLKKVVRIINLSEKDLSKDLCLCKIVIDF